MSKDLEKEYLEDLDHYDEGMGIHSTSYEKCKERLIRLAKIDNAKPSEALEELEMLHDCSTAIQELPSSNWVEYAENEAELDLKLYFGYENIKQALLKAQEQEKVIKIIFEKNVDIEYIKTCFYDEKGGLKEYNSWVGHDEDKELTKEEFDLLKRWSNEQDN